MNTSTNTSTFLRWFGLSRVALGLWMMLTPHTASTLWFGSPQDAASTSALVRSVGARDVGLGLGLALDPKRGSQWLRGGLIADSTDAIAAALVRKRIPRNNFLNGFIGAVIYAGIGCVFGFGTQRRTSA